MRIAVLTKRQYMSKDLVDDRYGRFFEIPLELARKGHSVFGFTLSYRKKDEGILIKEIENTRTIQWQSFNLKKLPYPRLDRYFKTLAHTLSEHQVDAIWACSDSIHAILGVKLAKQLDIPCIIDLYDNFESYGLTRFPGIFPRFKKAVQQAHGISCISQPLQEHILSNYAPPGNCQVIENAIPADFFCPLDRNECLDYFKLPEEATYIGTAGALNKGRGIEQLFSGFETLSKNHPNLHLLLAGPVGKETTLPSGEKIHYLGNLPYDDIPRVINALDLAVVCNLDTEFGRFCFPQKIYEILACRRPLIASAVGSTKTLLEKYGQCLFDPGNRESFIQAVEAQLMNPIVPDLKIPSWKDQAEKLEQMLTSL